MHKCSLVFVMIPIKHFFYNPQKYSYFRGILILHLFLCKAFRDVIQIHIGTYSPLHFYATYMYLVVKKMIENDVSYRHSSTLCQNKIFFSHPQDFFLFVWLVRKIYGTLTYSCFQQRHLGQFFSIPFFVCTQKGYSWLIQVLSVFKKMNVSTIYPDKCLLQFFT